MWCEKQRKATTPIHHTKTATFVSEFAVEDLPLGRNAVFVPKIAVKELFLGRTLMMMKMMICLYTFCKTYLVQLFQEKVKHLIEVKTY